MEGIAAIGSVATAIGVFLTWLQLRAAKNQARTQFEDGLVEQFRAIIRQLPVEALLGQPLSDDVHRQMLGVFYSYVDLCNEQAFLHKKGRIQEETWNEWRQGMESLLRLPAFSRAWLEIRSRASDSFTDLRALGLADSQLALAGAEMSRTVESALERVNGETR